MNRRAFLMKAALASSAISLVSLEEKILLGRDTSQSPDLAQDELLEDLPKGRIGDIEISRLICGGNLISGFAHSRDLIYVSGLLRNYFTDEKVLETLQKCEQNGINTAILRLDEHTLRILDKYWNERAGQIQWIVQIKPKQYDLQYFKADIQLAIDNGAIGAYIQGGVGDKLTESGDIELLGNALDYIKQQGVIAGIGGHSNAVPKACEKAGLDPDFYMKTLHSKDYWTFNPAKEPRDPFHVIHYEKTHDNVWCVDPEETIRFMGQVKKPWIGFKVMAAGAIHPRDAFGFAFDSGVDFICAGMFDFQIIEDAVIAKNYFRDVPERERSWYG